MQSLLCVVWIERVVKDARDAVLTITLEMGEVCLQQLILQRKVYGQRDGQKYEIIID